MGWTATQIEGNERTHVLHKLSSIEMDLIYLVTAEILGLN